jgi:hypothetical protein
MLRVGLLLVALAILGAAQRETVIAGLSYVVGAGVGDQGFLQTGKEAPFSLVTRVSSVSSASTVAPCLDVSRIQVTIKGPQDQSVGWRFTAPCSDGEYELAWTPCLWGWHSVAVAIDGAPVQNAPVTVFVSADGTTSGTETRIEHGGPSAAFDFDGLMRGTK